MKKTQVFFLDLILHAYFCVLAVLALTVVLGNLASLGSGQNTLAVLDQRAWETSTVLVKQPGCADAECETLWSGQNEPSQWGLAWIDGSKAVASNVLDYEKIIMLSQKNVSKILSPDQHVRIGLRIKMGEKTLLSQETSGGRALRRIVLVKTRNGLEKGTIEVSAKLS